LILIQYTSIPRAKSSVYKYVLLMIDNMRSSHMGC